MEDIVLETLMFTKPPEWGRRVIQRENEILLQETGDGGKTWNDSPIPEAKLIIPKAKTFSTNPYEGLTFQYREQERTFNVEGTKQVNPIILSTIETGQLLSVTEIESENGIVEEVRFLGTYARSGLPPGSVWRDNQNYLRIVP